jgi:hypothetical protein
MENHDAHDDLNKPISQARQLQKAERNISSILLLRSTNTTLPVYAGTDCKSKLPSLKNLVKLLGISYKTDRDEHININSISFDKIEKFYSISFPESLLKGVLWQDWFSSIRKIQILWKRLLPRGTFRLLLPKGPRFLPMRP